MKSITAAIFLVCICIQHNAYAKTEKANRKIAQATRNPESLVGFNHVRLNLGVRNAPSVELWDEGTRWRLSAPYAGRSDRYECIFINGNCVSYERSPFAIPERWTNANPILHSNISFYRSCHQAAPASGETFRISNVRIENLAVNDPDDIFASVSIIHITSETRNHCKKLEIRSGSSNANFIGGGTPSEIRQAILRTFGGVIEVYTE